ncbi:kinase A anchor protein [Emericellopsis atlantica]|uniref:Kinase A anchor protein n=1 Tax=Emericellopsis atlantica TaxID=2614577 RepID=A0A9P8CS02_9HYPO|nr:kinase A anchor protein [Emericellopsis atlantica]KAG9256680.1 kinase A anchor protein [Emericellopsis atlantica]
MPPRPMPTHFLCIPLSSPQLTRSLASFKTDITAPHSSAVPESAVRPPGTVHLTLGVMTLKDEVLTQAVSTLRGLSLKAVLEEARANPATEAAVELGSPMPSLDQKLQVTLKGIQPLQPPAQCRVLYAPPIDPSGLLRRFCELVRGRFASFMSAEELARPLLLHATVVNTIYVKGIGKSKGRTTIDARDIVGRYEDEVWMEGMDVDRVALCRMGAKAVEGSDGDMVYEVEAEVRVED